jgi:hypothetical protein
VSNEPAARNAAVAYVSGSAVTGSGTHPRSDTVASTDDPGSTPEVASAEGEVPTSDGSGVAPLSGGRFSKVPTAMTTARSKTMPPERAHIRPRERRDRRVAFTSHSSAETERGPPASEPTHPLVAVHASYAQLAPARRPACGQPRHVDRARGPRQTTLPLEPPLLLESLTQVDGIAIHSAK